MPLSQPLPIGMGRGVRFVLQLTFLLLHNYQLSIISYQFVAQQHPLSQPLPIGMGRGVRFVLQLHLVIATSYQLSIVNYQFVAQQHPLSQPLMFHIELAHARHS